MSDPTEGAVAPDATPTAPQPTSDPPTEPTAPEPSPPSAGPAAPSEPRTKSPESEDPVPPPAEWREDWRQAFAGKSEDDLKQLGRYKSPEGIWKAYKSLRSQMDSGEYTRTLAKDATEEQVAQWREENGIPAEPKGYYETLPEGMQIEDDERPFLDQLFSTMHAANATPEVVRQGLAVYYQTQADALEVQYTSDEQTRVNTEEELRAEWGPEYRINIGHMNQVLFDSGIFVQAPEGLKQRLTQARFDDGTPVAHDADFQRWLVDMARVINPDIGHAVTPAAGANAAQSVDDRIAELEAMSGDTRSQYWTGANADALQAELRNLYDMQEKMQARR